MVPCVRVAGFRSFEHADAVIQLATRAAQIELFASEFRAAAGDPDLAGVMTAIGNLRNELALAELVTVSMTAPDFSGAVREENCATGVERITQSRCKHNMEDICEHHLADRLLAIMMALEKLKHASVVESGSLAFGFVEARDIAEFIYHRIGSINESWLSAKRSQRREALEHALRSLDELGAHSGVRRSLAELSRLESVPLRRVCEQLVTLLAPGLALKGDDHAQR